MCLLHDIGSGITDLNHAEISASIVKPYVSEALHWTVLHHEIFQSYNYFESLGLDKNAKLQFVDHPNYKMAEEFCQLYDAPAWDAGYQPKDLNFFKPIVEEVVYAKTQLRKIKS